MLVPSEAEQEPQPQSPASSFLSDTVDADGQRPSKRRRVSYSSLSSASSSSSSGDEEKPLATKRAERAEKKSAAGRHSKGTKGGRKVAGKGMASMKSKAHTAPVALPPPTEAERADMAHPATNGVNGHDVKVKVEDKMDEGQLTRLVTGVTVDTGGAPSSAAVSCIV